jgi:hypothetical protein
MTRVGSQRHKKLTKNINKNKFWGFGHGFCKNRSGFWDNACDKIGYFLAKIINKYLDFLN